MKLLQLNFVCMYVANNMHNNCNDLSIVEMVGIPKCYRAS